MQRFFLQMWMPRLAAVAALALAPATASADFLTTQVQQFAVLGQPTNDQTNYNNGNIVGDVGIGSPRQFTISNANLTGNIRFSGATNTSGLSPDPDPNGGVGPFAVSGGGTFTGKVFANDAVVTQAITYVNDLSQALGTNAGTNTTVTPGGSINVSAGTLGTTASVDGNPLGAYRVFTVTSANFPNGTFTINGSATDQVVLNIGFNANLHGQILLAGGITTDHVIINLFGGNPATFSGGPTLDVNTNGLSTFGTFLDPFGGMSAVHTDIQGRFFGGDSVNQQIVSGANITAPAVTAVPLPSAAVLALSGLLTAGLLRLRRNRRRLEVAAA
jgi:hypothetical protein